jgi:hypothetical protein
MGKFVQLTVSAGKISQASAKIGLAMGVRFWQLPRDAGNDSRRHKKDF